MKTVPREREAYIRFVQSKNAAAARAAALLVAVRAYTSTQALPVSNQDEWDWVPACFSG